MPAVPMIAPSQQTSLALAHRNSTYKLDPMQADRLRRATQRMVDISRQAAGDNRGWWAYAGIHGYPQYKCQHSTDANQWARLFLPWHRAYLYHLELQMQAFVPGVNLAWWDWPTGRTSPGSGIPPLYADQQAGRAANPLYAAPVPTPLPQPTTVRHPQPAAGLPSPQDVEAVLAVADWHDFSYRLESLLHNRVHGWTGGFMGQVPLAAYDPVFFAHHTMVDRLWAIWQVRHAQAGPPPTDWGTVLDPFNLKVSDVLDTTKLGYDYAASSFHLPVV